MPSRQHTQNSLSMSGVRLALCRTGIALFLCLPWISNSAAAEPNKTVLVAVDLSSSTKDHRQDYVTYFRKILDVMGERDVLLVTRIMKHPSASETLAFPPVVYEEGSLLKNRRQAQEAGLKASLEALKSFEALVKERVDNETPIVEVTQEATRLFQQFPTDRRVIVYLSDMMEYSKTTANFESAKPIFNKTTGEAAFQKLKKEGRIAALKGTKVYVAGARDADPQRKDAVRAFWTAYFAEAGASLDPAHYGADLLVFDECNRSGSCARFFTDHRDQKLRK